ncbi:TonB-dependent receptor plug domain-containing protein [Myroides sp. NP-2]|uniref:TonB-dependent receptor plug domain-containing protein n=1 Tax=Myroides sp. NP-2 TaxID=2759945 RepID=UPI0015FB1170|nr:TonB-dependent receptor plug domain-containing protein [Myroides sp. NP-2]MBB1150323.1 TonB-dependent receptor plug domain-containing protein [Myroides sp. NP-2]
MKTKITSFTFLLLFFFVGLAQVNAGDRILSGVVRNEKKEPISYAIVQLKELNKQVLTDEEGKFHFTAIDFGHYNLGISSMEIKNKEVAIVYESKHDYFVVTVESSEGINLNEMIIHVQNEKRQLETKGYAVNVIQPANLALQSIQLNELLDRTAGVKIRQDGGLGSKVNYNINGLSGRSIQIFIDGIPAQNYGSSFSLNSIPPALIERIEVYKGVVPIYLSQDALGGAINVVLKQKVRNAWNVSGSYGSFNTHQYNMNGSFRQDNGFTIHANGFINYSDNNYRVYGKHVRYIDGDGNVTLPKNGAKRFHDRYRSHGAKIDVGFTEVNWADKFLFGGVISGYDKDVQHGSTMEKVYGDRFTKRDSYISTLTYSKKDVLLQGMEVKLDASYSDLTRQVVDTVGNMYDWSGKPIRDRDGNIVKYNTGAEVAAQKTLEKNRDKLIALRANLAYEFTMNNTLSVNYFYNTFKREIQDELQPVSLQKLVNTRDLQKDIISFSYENISFNQRLRTTLFYKMYHQKATSNEPYRDDTKPLLGDLYKVNRIYKTTKFKGYGGSMSYRLFDQFYVLGSAEKAIRLPAETELFGSNADNLLPSFDLDPEQSTNLNIGFNSSVFHFQQHALSLNATFFYRKVKGMIREALDSRGIYTQYENLDDVLSKGVDLEVHYAYKDRLVLDISVSKFDVLFNKKYNKEGAIYNYYKTQIRNEPSFKYNANLSYTFHDILEKNDKIRVNYNVYYVEKFLRNWSNVGGTNLDEIPTQSPHDFGVLYQFANKKMSASLDVKNLFNQRIYDNFGLQKPGRALYAKVTYSIF